VKGEEKQVGFDEKKVDEKVNIPIITGTRESLSVDQMRQTPSRFRGSLESFH